MAVFNARAAGSEVRLTGGTLDAVFQFNSSTVVQLNNPGKVGGFALNDTITTSQTFGDVGVDETTFVVTADFTGLAMSGTGTRPTAGTLDAFFVSSTGAITGSSVFTGLNVSAVEIYDAIHTKGLADNKALYAHIFDGADTLKLSAFDDEAAAGLGADWVHGYGGNDTLSGGQGNDHLFGGIGNDRLAGGTGKDRMSGGDGADVFQFHAQEHARISDFQNGLDHLRIVGPAQGFADLAISQMNANTLITAGTLSILLVGIDHGAIDASDFSFV
jgi:Ca2+-binding RTX toxin-like protein